MIRMFSPVFATPGVDDYEQTARRTMPTVTNRCSFGWAQALLSSSHSKRCHQARPRARVQLDWRHTASAI